MQFLEVQSSNIGVDAIQHHATNPIVYDLLSPA
jgi:hypothetical protein